MSVVSRNLLKNSCNEEYMRYISDMLVPLLENPGTSREYTRNVAPLHDHRQNTKKLKSSTGNLLSILQTSTQVQKNSTINTMNRMKENAENNLQHYPSRNRQRDANKLIRGREDALAKLSGAMSSVETEPLPVPLNWKGDDYIIQER